MYERLSASSVGHAEHPAILEYGDGQLPRFTLPEDELIISDWRLVRDRLDEAMAADPAIVGATAFGSTTKGYADPTRSDIDLTIFVDTDTLGLRVRPDLVSSAQIGIGDWHGFEGIDQGPEKAIRTRIRYQDTVERIFSIHNGAPHLPVRPEAYPINHGYLNILAAFESSYAARLARYHELLRAGDQLTDTDRLANWSTVSTNPVILQGIPRLADEMTDNEKRYGIDVLAVRTFLGRKAAEEGTELAHLRTFAFYESRLASALPMRLFNLALSPGLAPYRRTFLEGLAQAPDPELAYTYFIGRLRAFEDSPKHPRDTLKVSYPATLAEALEVYG